MTPRFLDARSFDLAGVKDLQDAAVSALRRFFDRDPKLTLGIGLLIALALAIYFFAATLSADGAITLIVLTAAVVLWTLSPVDDTKVAIGAVLVLAVTGVVDKDQIYGALGHELVWLLIASFVIAAVLRASGLMERAVVAIAAYATSYRQLFYSLAIAISATAFLIPSTSARAAMLVPVYLAFAAKVADPSTRRALALLFPTAILLSAGGSLIGAGAHAIAVETIGRTTGTHLDYVGWLLIAAPFALASTLAATWLIMALFTSRAQLSAAVSFDVPKQVPLTSQQRLIVSVVAGMVLLWVTAPVHGIGIGLVALAAMAILLAKPISPIKAKEAYKSVEIELLVFLTMAFVLADAMSRSGADTWLAQSLLVITPASVKENRVAIVVLLATISLLAHLIVTSRTARASVLIPSVTVPMIGLGHDPLMLVMITVLGTGFCQTMTASAKPVAIFANLDTPTFAPADLTRLSLALLPVMLVGLVITALTMWRI